MVERISESLCSKSRWSSRYTHGSGNCKSPTHVGGPPTHGSGNCKPPTHVGGPQTLCVRVWAAYVCGWAAYAEVLEIVSRLRTWAAYACASGPPRHVRGPPTHGSGNCKPPTHVGRPYAWESGQPTHVGGPPLTFTRMWPSSLGSLRTAYACAWAAAHADYCTKWTCSDAHIQSTHRYLQ